LPPSGGFDSVNPSFAGLRSINLSLLFTSLKPFIFGRLPQIIAERRENVKWHYNPLCRNCHYDRVCRSNAVREGNLGSMPNVSFAEAEVLRELLVNSRQPGGPTSSHGLTDIEDLHMLVSDQGRFDAFHVSSPNTAREAKRILGLPLRTRKGLQPVSAAVEAARTNTIQVNQFSPHLILLTF
jgi:hypothetical protein